MARRWNAVPSEQAIKTVGELLMDSQSMMGLQCSGTPKTRGRPAKSPHKYHCHIGNHKCRARCCWHQRKDARGLSFFSFSGHVLSKATVAYISPRAGREGEKRARASSFPTLELSSWMKQSHWVTGITAVSLQPACLAGQSPRGWHQFQNRGQSLDQTQLGGASPGSPGCNPPNSV